jgi:hypothetical protein
VNSSFKLNQETTSRNHYLWLFLFQELFTEIAKFGRNNFLSQFADVGFRAKWALGIKDEAPAFGLLAEDGEASVESGPWLVAFTRQLQLILVVENTERQVRSDEPGSDV